MFRHGTKKAKTPQHAFTSGQQDQVQWAQIARRLKDAKDSRCPDFSARAPKKMHMISKPHFRMNPATNAFLPSDELLHFAQNTAHTASTQLQ